MDATLIQPDTSGPERLWYSCRLRWLVLLGLVLAGSLLSYRQIRRSETVESIIRIRGLGGYRNKSDWEKFNNRLYGKAVDPWDPRANKLRWEFECPVLANGYELALPAGATDDNLAGIDLASAFPLRALRLRSTDITDAGLDALRSLHELRALNLAHTGVTDAGLSKLKHMTELQWLNLAGLEITDAGVAELKAIRQLQWLSLHDTNVTDVATEHLEALPQLQVLILRNTAVTDAAIEHLRQLQQLQSLDLRKTEVTSEGVAELQASLPGCKIETQH